MGSDVKGENGSYVKGENLSDVKGENGSDEIIGVAEKMGVSLRRKNGSVEWECR